VIQHKYFRELTIFKNTLMKFICAHEHLQCHVIIKRQIHCCIFVARINTNLH